MQIPQKTSIHDRPKDVGERLTVGHWETDTVIFSHQKSCLSVQLERMSRLVRIHRVPNKGAEATNQAIRCTIDSLPSAAFKTLTHDNGLENVLHTNIRDDYGIDTYFCDTYASWQKGGVENVNRMIRWHLPRKTNLSALTDEEITAIQEAINDTPRKSLRYLTPNEFISQYLGEVVH